MRDRHHNMRARQDNQVMTHATERPVTASQLKLREILERRAEQHRAALDLIFHIERVQRLQAHLAVKADR
jgi:hypothetical protein